MAVVTERLSFMLVFALQISLCQEKPTKHVCNRAFRFSKDRGKCVPCTVTCLQGEGQERNCGFNESGDRVRDRCQKCQYGTINITHTDTRVKFEYRVCACPPGYYDGEPFGTPGCTRCGPCCGASQEHLARAECKKSGMGVKCSCAPNSHHLCAAGRWSDLVEKCNAIHDNLTKYRHIHLRKKGNTSKIIKSRDIVARTPVGTIITRRAPQMTDTSQNSTSIITTPARPLHPEAKDLERKTKRTTATTKTTNAMTKHKSPTDKASTRHSYNEDSRNVTFHSSSTQQTKTNHNFTLPGNRSLTGKSRREFLLLKISSTKTTYLEGSSDREMPTKLKAKESQLSAVIGVTAALTCIIITVIALMIMKCKSKQRGRSPNGQETSLQESQPLDGDLENPKGVVEGCVEDIARGGAEREPLNKAVPFNYEDKEPLGGSYTSHEAKKVEGLRRCQRTFLIEKLDTESQGFTNWKELAQHFGVPETTI